MTGQAVTRAVVTGASAGIGRSITERLAADGYKVITIDRVRPALLAEGEDFYQADLADPTATAKVLEEISARGAVTVLVNNVGTVRPNPVESSTLEDLHAVVALNLGAALQCVQAFLPAMKKAGSGRVVNISSRAALGKELRSVYSATKAGLLGMTRTWALELAPLGITVNAIGPGPIDTELFRKVNPPDSRRTRAIVEGVPVRRLGTGDDIANAVAFFADARSSFVTGQVLYVCGGMTVGVNPL